MESGIEEGSEGSAGNGSSNFQFGKALVISESSVLREMLRLVLAPRAGTVLVARSIRDGMTVIAKNADTALVLSDVELIDGSGFNLLEYVRSLEEPRPDVILLTSNASDPEAERAAKLGALGLLRKPICYRDIATVLRRSKDPRFEQRAERKRSNARAYLLDAGRPAEGPDAAVAQLVWYVRDLSATGAFLETETSLPIGMNLDLLLELGSKNARLTAEVVRVQVPSWEYSGGVGVSFVGGGGGLMDVLDDLAAVGTRRPLGVGLDRGVRDVL